MKSSNKADPDRGLAECRPVEVSTAVCPAPPSPVTRVWPAGPSDFCG